LALGVAGLLTLVVGEASAEPRPVREPSSEGHQTALWVPSLFGEWAFRVGVDSRLELGAPDALLLPSTTGRVDAGYRIYLDDRGRFGLGAYASGGLSLPLTADVDRGDVKGLGGGVTFQYRAMHEEFIYVAFGSFIEASALRWSGGATPLPGAALPEAGGDGLRWAVGMEVGPGLLWWLDPFVFGESTVRFGLEYVRIGGAELTSALFGWSLGSDVASRRGE